MLQAAHRAALPANNRSIPLAPLQCLLLAAAQYSNLDAKDRPENQDCLMIDLPSLGLGQAAAHLEVKESPYGWVVLLLEHHRHELTEQA